MAVSVSWSILLSSSLTASLLADGSEMSSPESVSESSGYILGGLLLSGLGLVVFTLGELWPDLDCFFTRVDLRPDWSTPGQRFTERHYSGSVRWDHDVTDTQCL